MFVAVGLSSKPMDLVRNTVLLVEDEPDLRGLYATILTSAGFNVQQAADGEEALDMIDDTMPDIVVLDLWLPTLDGYTVLAEIAANTHTHNVPVIVVTGTDTDLRRVRTARVLRKPVDPADLVAAVRESIAGATPTA
jgi:two-component system phosphate regulon response regulator PhoB